MWVLKRCGILDFGRYVFVDSSLSSGNQILTFPGGSRAHGRRELRQRSPLDDRCSLGSLFEAAQTRQTLSSLGFILNLTLDLTPQIDLLDILCCIKSIWILIEIYGLFIPWSLREHATFAGPTRRLTAHHWQAGRSDGFDQNCTRMRTISDAGLVTSDRRHH